MSGLAGQGIALLDWITVAKGGWTKTFTGTRLATYRADTGNRFTLRVNNTDPQFLIVRSYQTMTSVSVGAGMFPSTTQFAADKIGIPLCVTVNTPCRYWGVRTNRWFTLILEYSNDATKSRTIFSFGDVPSLCEADAFNTIMTFAADPYYNVISYNSNLSFITLQVNGPYHPTASGIGWIGVAGSPNGSVVSPVSHLNAPYGQLSISDTDAALFSNNGRLNYSGFIVSSCASATDAVGRYPRANIPNIHQLANPISATPNNAFAAYDEELITIGEKTFLVLRDKATYASAFMLEITDTDGAL